MERLHLQTAELVTFLKLSKTYGITHMEGNFAQVVTNNLLKLENDLVFLITGKCTEAENFCKNVFNRSIKLASVAAKRAMSGEFDDLEQKINEIRKLAVQLIQIIKNSEVTEEFFQDDPPPAKLSASDINPSTIKHDPNPIKSSAPPGRTLARSSTTNANSSRIDQRQTTVPSPVKSAENLESHKIDSSQTRDRSSSGSSSSSGSTPTNSTSVLSPNRVVHKPLPKPKPASSSSLTTSTTSTASVVSTQTPNKNLKVTVSENTTPSASPSPSPSTSSSSLASTSHINSSKTQIDHTHSALQQSSPVNHTTVTPTKGTIERPPVRSKSTGAVNAAILSSRAKVGAINASPKPSTQVTPATPPSSSSSVNNLSTGMKTSTPTTSPTIKSPQPTTPQPITPQQTTMSNSESKWQCSRCTVFNIPTALKCAMCGSSKNQTDQQVETPSKLVKSTSSDVVNRRTISTSPSAISNYNTLKPTSGNTVASPSSSAPTSTTNTVHASSTASDNHSSAPTSVSTQSWKCKSCTVSNPPGTTKCSMCGNSKEEEAVASSGEQGSSNGRPQAQTRLTRSNSLNRKKNIVHLNQANVELKYTKFHNQT
eukprot:TRINITY_DN2611_c0_g1_i1.p1 TRINITY_DN2611_c0_g1~~TRINITY_DN2611_c0_g1_i1.p1  ORF type:complete len:596 (+),score=172.45 TRINITY_DN2611_c0_g1_i1:157-1944(+)